MKVFPLRFVDYFLKENTYQYIDKSMFIKRALSNNFPELIIRPQNFGKSFNLKTLKYFLSNSEHLNNFLTQNDRRKFFEQTQIFKQETQFFESNFANRPVVLINFKELDQRNFIDNIEKFRHLIFNEYETIFHYESLKGLSDLEMRKVEDFFINFRTLDPQQLIQKTNDLIRLLLKLNRKHPFLLIDDYDYPLVNASKDGYYPQMVEFLKDFFKRFLRNNNDCEKIIITGFAGIEANEIFANHLRNLHIFNGGSNDVYAKDFGLTEEEVNEYFSDLKKQDSLLNNGTGKDYVSLKKLYGGYSINNVDLYNTMEFINLRKSNFFLNSNLSLADEFKLKDFFNETIKESNVNKIDGLKLLITLKHEADYLIENKSNLGQLSKMYKDLIKDSSTMFPSGLDKTIETSNLISYLLCCGLLSHSNNELNITNIHSAKYILNVLPNESTFTDYKRKLVYNYYTYFYFNQDIEKYVQSIQTLCKEMPKKSKLLDSLGHPLYPNIQFRNDKELENYFIDVFSLEMNSKDSNADVSIYSIEDLDDMNVSNNLKKFTLILYENLNFAVFLYCKKYKKIKLRGLNLNENERDEDTELFNNIEFDIVQAQAKRKRSRKSSGSGGESADFIIEKEMKQICEDAIGELDIKEAKTYLGKINENITKMLVVTISNHGRIFSSLVKEENIEQL